MSCWTLATTDFGVTLTTPTDTVVFAIDEDNMVGEIVGMCIATRRRRGGGHRRRRRWRPWTFDGHLDTASPIVSFAHTIEANPSIVPRAIVGLPTRQWCAFPMDQWWDYSAQYGVWRFRTATMDVEVIVYNFSNGYYAHDVTFEINGQTKSNFLWVC